MATRVRVAIATTAGPVAVERIAGVDFQKSRVHLWAARSALPAMSETYDKFVRERVARIPPFDRDQVLRLDLSREIDEGDSWQLPVFLAHALHGAERLAGRGEDDEAGIFLYATGELDFELTARQVGSVEDKLRLLAQDQRLQSAAAGGRRVLLALPEANADEARPEQDRLRRLGTEIVPVREVTELLHRLDLAVRPRGPHPEDSWEGSPFRGLEVFDIDHRKIFFGRGKAREEAMQLLRRQDLAGCAFLLIHGRSGVGKSSLARAGLLADLQHGASPNDRWRIVTVVPRRGNRTPVAALAEALEIEVPEIDMPELAARILSDPAATASAIAAALTRAEAQGRVRVALLVDQLEELLLWAREERTAAAAAERDAFAELLAWLARTGLVWVIATLRSDLMPFLADSPVLSELARNDRLYRLEPPRPGALGEIIRGPAELAGIHFVGGDEDGQPLVEVLTDAAKHQQDCLPLLEFTLKLLYDEGKGRSREISYQQYKKNGELEDAIGLWADKAIAALGGDAEIERAVDDVIFNLARRGRGTDAVATDLFLGDTFLDPARAAVIRALETARLIVLDADPKTQRRTARVAHEALLTHWRRAGTLFETHGAKLALKDDIERAAIRWHDQSRGDGFLILGEAPIIEAEQLLSDSRVQLTDLAREYIQVSVETHRERATIIRERLARDEQRVTDLIRAGEYEDAVGALSDIAGYLTEEGDLELRQRRALLGRRRARVARLAEYDGFARLVLQKAGEEDFEQARLNCEAALRTLGVAHDEDWWDQLPIEDLSPEQVTALRQNIYRTLLVHSGLQIVPGLQALFPGRQDSAAPRIPSWAPGLILRLLPKAAIRAVLRRGGIGPMRLPASQDNAEAQAAFDRCRATLATIQRLENSESGPPLQTRLLVERLVSVFSELAAGPKGTPIDFIWLLSTRAAAFAEPVNAADYFLIALFNYFVAKRASAGAAAAFLALVRGNFPELDPRAPLATTERLLRVATGLEPRNYWPHWVLGRVLLEAGNYAAAELAFNTAVALEPGYARGYEQRALALAKQWTLSRDERLRRRALRDSRLAGQLANGDPSIFWPRGELFDVLGETAAALDSWCFWLELEPDILGRVARSDGVKRLLDRTTAMLGDTGARPLHAAAGALLALVHWTRGLHDAAVKAAAKAIAIDPGQAHALAAKGAALLKMEEPERALAEGLEPALVASPGNFFALRHRALALEALSRSAAAEAAWAQLLARAEEAADDKCPAWIIEMAKDRLARPHQPQAA
jgi:tetratricopeptide (TPR) repeat protein